MADFSDKFPEERTCPSCRSIVPASVERCSCGAYLGAAGSHADGLVTQAEALYESYLNARLQRAVKTLQSARAALARNPAQAMLTQQMRECTREIETLRAQLAAQAARIEEARRKDAEGKRSPTLSGGPNVQSAPDDSFRQAQAAMASGAVEEAKRAQLLNSPKEDSTFNAAQAVRAQRIAGAADLCPVCRTGMGPDGRCQACGYTRRPVSNDQDFLSKEEIAALIRPLAR
jgi:hypothetical protein